MCVSITINQMYCGLESVGSLLLDNYNNSSQLPSSSTQMAGARKGTPRSREVKGLSRPFVARWVKIAGRNRCCTNWFPDSWGSKEEDHSGRNPGPQATRCCPALKSWKGEKWAGGVGGWGVGSQEIMCFDTSSILCLFQLTSSTTHLLHTLFGCPTYSASFPPTSPSFPPGLHNGSELFGRAELVAAALALGVLGGPLEWSEREPHEGIEAPELFLSAPPKHPGERFDK